MDLEDVETTRGVCERGFVLDVDGERVPGLIWTPEGASGPRPTILIGHGGSQHKRVPNVLALARRLVRHQGFAAVAIDAPGHGDRAQTDRAEAPVPGRGRRRPADELTPGQARALSRRTELTPEQLQAMSRRRDGGIAEWKATLDAVETVDEVGSGPFGYWGVSMGTSIGLPFVAAEPRIECAVLGLAGLSGRPGGAALEQAAERLTVPLLFVFQWADELASHEEGLALFDAMGSAIKTMHINPGGHVEMPLFERDEAEAFFVRHLVNRTDA